MKKIIVLSSVLVLSFMLAACGGKVNNNQEIEKPVTEENGQGAVNNPSDQTAPPITNGTDNNPAGTTGQAVNSASQEDMQKKMADIDYADFELSVEYANYQEYEAELEKKSSNLVEAEIDDTINNVKKKGPDAFDELYPLVKQVKITQQTAKADAIQEVMKVFNLPADYTEFELKIKFTDGTKIEFEDRK